jgi:integrase
MTPTTLIIDRTFAGVGRIKRASGTTNPAVRRKINRMLDTFEDEGRLDLLRALRDGDLTFMQVHDAYQRKALDQLPTADTIRPLGETMRAWIAEYECSDKHRISLGTSCGYFESSAPKASVADIARVLERLRDSLGKAHPRSFNLARAAALAFVRHTLKKSHPLWLAVAAVEPRKYKPAVKRRPITPDVMRNLFPAPESDPVDAIAWGVAVTGMGAHEYWGTWSVGVDRIHIVGTKRDGRVRDVPRVMVPASPSMHRRTWEDKVRERTTIITPYDLRRTFANWMESAGIPRTRRRLYRGHGPQDIGDLYEQHEVETYLVEDAAKLRAWLGLDATTLPALRLETANR